MGKGLTDENVTDGPLLNDLPLKGVKVLDISNYLAAPSITMYMGDYGAEIIKVERPGNGDEMRNWGHSINGIGLYWKVVGRNKKSITVDIKKPLGQEIIRRLAKEADVVVENFRPGTLEKWNLGYEQLSEINPALIMVRITGYGQYGPYHRKPGFGTVAEAFSGFVHISGQPDRPPLLPGFGLADSTTGICGAFLTMVALYNRDIRNGKGQFIDLAIYEPLFTLLGPQVVDYDQLDIVQERQGSRLPFAAPRNIYQTKDGKYVSIAGSSQSVFERIARALGIEELIQDPRFRGNRERIENVEELDNRLQEAVAKFPLDELLTRLDRFEAAVSPVYNIADIFKDPHFQERKNIVDVKDSELGMIRMQNVVGKLQKTPGKIRSSGPRLGEHNHEILIDQLGYTEEELRVTGMMK